MYKHRITTALLNATLLSIKALKGECTIQEFVRKYGNFYYYEALDGHEADDEQQRVLDELQSVIEFHRKIQMEVVDLVSLDDSNNTQQYTNSGRITENQAKEKLKKLSKEYDAEGFLENLVS